MENDAVVGVMEYCIQQYTWKVTLFFILCTVTVLRKKLSSNRIYYAEEPLPSSLKNKSLRTDPYVKPKVLCSRLSWSSLSENILQKFCSFLLPEDILSFIQTNQTTYQICNHDHVWKTQWKYRFEELCQSPLWLQAMQTWGFTWKSADKPLQGWRQFYFEFELSWVNMVTAGHDSEEFCLLGLENKVYDVTSFVSCHPGGPETMLYNSGVDSTLLFLEIGHSKSAKALLQQFLVLQPRGPRKLKIPDQFSVAGSNVVSKPYYSLNVPILQEESFLQQSSKVPTVFNLDATKNVCETHTGRVNFVYFPMDGRWAFWRTCCKTGGWLQVSKNVVDLSSRTTWLGCVAQECKKWNVLPA